MSPIRAVGRGAFPRIGEYGFLSDCHTGALVAPDGGIEWLCLPRFDSPSVFGAALDRDAGSFRISPAMRVPLARRYEPGTNIVETVWATPTGWLEVRDALTIGKWQQEGADSHARPPSDHEADHVLVRTIECLQGTVEVELVCEPAPDYARRRPSWELEPDRRAALADGPVPMRLISDVNLGVERGRVIARHALEEGERRFCALTWNETLQGPRDAEEAFGRVAHTAEFWRRWLGGGRFPDHPWRVHLQRSALTLKGLTHAPTGAMVAALTTSLPEAIGGERNWDYRYTWIRDATFTLWALHVLGFEWEAADFMEFIAQVCRHGAPELQIMYGIGGERDLTERTLPHLSGYENSRPVRIGNAAYKQRQHDVYGALLDSVYLHTKVRGHLPEHLWTVVSDQVEATVRVWSKPDQGIWETRGDPKHYVSSKLMCWVAMDRGARLARRRGESELEERWRGIASEIRAEILERGVSERGVFRQHYETDALDASTLLVPLVRFLPRDDERLRDTVLAIAEELTESGLVLRYRVEETDDGLAGEEGTFTICSFWLVSALAEIGERKRARELCERVLGLAGALNLYGEEIEASTGCHLGNFPQAFTHLALINAVTHVIADDLAGDDREGPTGVFTETRARH
jgi:GH15 family glucan-1,4-alpha-glucosidase